MKHQTPKGMSPLPWKYNKGQLEQITDANGQEVAGVYPNEGGGFHNDVDIEATVRAVNSYYSRRKRASS